MGADIIEGMRRRRVIIGVGIGCGLVLAVVASLWVILALWVPTHGKILLLRAVEQPGTMSASLRSLRYRPFQGVLLDELRLAERATGQTTLHAPIVTLGIKWFPLLVKRELAFRAQGLLTHPCPTTFTASGRYTLRTKTLLLDAHSTDIPLDRVSAPMASWLPAALREGTVQLQVHLVRRPGAPLQCSGRVTGSRLVWSSAAIRATGDLVLNGDLTTSTPSSPWSLRATVTLQHGTLEGLPHVSSIDRMEGTARLTEERLEITRVRGETLGSSWDLEGRVTFRNPSVELLVTSHAQLAPLSDTFFPLHDAWRAAGGSDLRVVCRGPLWPTPTFDCLGSAALRDVTLTGPTLTAPFTQLTGWLLYDQLARHVTVQDLSGSLMNERLVVNGTVQLSTPTDVSLDVSGTVALPALTGWLPANGPVRDLTGTAALALRLDGPTDALRPTGRVELREAGVRLPTLHKTLEGIAGLITVDDQTLRTEHLALRLDGQPLTLTATLTRGDLPRLDATLELPQGKSTLIARLAPDDVLIDEATLSLAATRLQVSGQWAWSAARTSTLTASGTMELAELGQLPLMTASAFEPWRLQGPVTFEATFQGPLADWRDGALRGRLSARRILIRDVPIEQLSCEFDQRNRILRARIPSSQIAEGRCVGELTIQHHAPRSDYLLQADLVGLQLARLTQVIPAWRTRAVRGNASAHTFLSGTWQERATWTGEGWLNASGEQLGDVPLLDKVLRGVFGVLADRLGLDTLRRAQITQLSGRWRLSKERLWTEDLRIGGMGGSEPVALYVRGSVGLDQTLDFTIEPELSEETVLRAPSTSTLSSAVLKAAGQLDRLRRLIGRHRLTGTLKAPTYRFEFSMAELFKQLAPGPADLLQGLLESLRQ